MHRSLENLSAQINAMQRCETQQRKSNLKILKILKYWKYYINKTRWTKQKNEQNSIDSESLKLISTSSLAFKVRSVQDYLLPLCLI